MRELSYEERIWIRFAAITGTFFDDNPNVTLGTVLRWTEEAWRTHHPEAKEGSNRKDGER